jgi:hypothetical protein
LAPYLSLWYWSSISTNHFSLISITCRMYSFVVLTSCGIQPIQLLQTGTLDAAGTHERGLNLGVCSVSVGSNSTIGPILLQLCSVREEPRGNGFSDAIKVIGTGTRLYLHLLQKPFQLLPDVTCSLWFPTDSYTDTD